MIYKNQVLQYNTFFVDLLNKPCNCKKHILLYYLECNKFGSSLFSVGNGSLCIGFADPGTRPRTPGIYRFEVQTWLL